MIDARAPDGSMAASARALAIRVYRAYASQGDGSGSKPEDVKRAVSSNTPLLVTKMLNNLCIWGEPACDLAAAPTEDKVAAVPAPPQPPKASSQAPDNSACVTLPSQPTEVCWTAMSIGDGHVAAITARGELFTWGRNTRGQCGHDRPSPPAPDSSDDESLPTRPQPVQFHVPLTQLPHPRAVQVQVRQVTCGGSHTLAITTAGVFSWGCNALGQCGLGDGAPDAVSRPTPVAGLRSLQVHQLAAGLAHSMALTSSSQVLSWGDGASGQLGLSDRQPRRAPEFVEALWALPVVQIAAGDAHSAAVTSSGHAFAWGCNYFGQLGLLPEPWQQESGRAGPPVAAVQVGSEAPAGLKQANSDREQGQGSARLEKAAAAVEARAYAAGADVERNRCSGPTAGHPGRGDVGPPAAVDVGPVPPGRRQAEQRQRQATDGWDQGSPRTPCGGVRGIRDRLCGGPQSLNSPRTPTTPGSARRAALRRNGAPGRTNPQWLLAMVEMGIPARHARIALEETGNAGVEVATEWLFAADRSALLDDPSDGEEEEAATSAGPPACGSGGPQPSATGIETASRPSAGSSGRGQGSAGGASSCGTSEGQGACYGSPAGGDLVGVSSAGCGWWDDLVVPQPRRVPLRDVRFLAAGARHTVAVTDHGIFAWGEGTAGALGLGDVESRDLPCRVEAFLATTADAAGTSAPPSPALNPLSAAASATQQYARSRLGFAAGGLADRRSGGGGCGGAGSKLPAAASIQRVSCGAQHTLFLAQDGSIFWCGTMPYSAGIDTLVAVPARPSLPSQAAWPVQEGRQQWDTSSGEDGAAGGGGAVATAEDVVVASTGSRLAFSAIPRRLELVLKPNAPGLPGTVRVSEAAVDTAAVAAAPAGPVVYDIVARGAASAVLMCAPREFPQVLDGAGGLLLLDKLRAAITSAARARSCGDLARLSASLKAVAAGIKAVLSSPAAISAAFGRRSGMGLDGQLLEDVLTSVRQLFGSRAADTAGTGGDSAGRDGMAGAVTDLHRFSVVAALQSAAATLVDDLAAHAPLLGTPERAQVLLAALQHPLLSEPQCAKQLLPKLAATVMAAPPVVRTWLVRWWAEYPGPLLESRVVAPLQAFLTRELGVTKKLTTALMDVIKVLARVAEAASLSNSLPPEAFYNKLISEKLDVQDHYSAWRQAQELSACREVPREAPFSFCSYPFLLNARAKSHLLHLEARFQMEQSVAHARMEVQLYGRGLAAQRRAAEGLVLVKPVGAANRHSSIPGSGGSSSAAHGIRRSSSSHSGADAASNSSPPSSSSTSSCASSGNSGASSYGRCISSNGSSSSSSSSSSTGSIVSGSLRSLFSLLRRCRVTPDSGSSGADGTGAKDQHDKVRNSDSGGSSSSSSTAVFELPSPAQCQVPGEHPDMCILRVRRTHLVADALAELGRQARRDLLKPLRVHFIGEEGIDAGGVKKEFFALLMERLLSPDYGMMTYDESSRTYWFNPASLESTDSYFLLGLVLGLAVYNRVLLAFPAPLLLYQKLRGGRELGLRDLEGWQPELARGLRQLLEYDGPEPLSEVFGLTFAVDIDCFGHKETVPLIPGGELMPVTEDNRAEYVQLLAAWHMGGSVAAQFEAFASGFRVLCGGPAMSLFNAQELERLVCGNPRLDFGALREAARYDGGYSRDTPVVCWLWDIVLNELGVEDQRAFLKFFTGSDRSPLGGLGSLRPVLQRDGPDSHKLPTAHTCFNTLLLPEYSTRDKLTALLRLAINNSEGFGLQ